MQGADHLVRAVPLAESPSAKRSVSLTKWPLMSNRTVALDAPDRRLAGDVLRPSVSWVKDAARRAERAESGVRDVGDIV